MKRAFNVTLSIGILVALGVSPIRVKADSFTVQDLTDTLSIDHQGVLAVMESSSCSVGATFESCTFTFTNAGPGSLGFVFNEVDRSDAPGIRILEPDGSLSDFTSFTVNPSGPNGHVTINFYSDIDGVPFNPPGLTTTCVGPCPSIVENGGTQPAFGVAWPDRTDTVSFHSDAVPEPSSIILLGTALMLAAGGMRLRSVRS